MSICNTCSDVVPSPVTFQAIDSIHQVGVYCLALVPANTLPKTPLGGIHLSETKQLFLEGSLHPCNVLMCPHTCVTNLPKPRQKQPGRARGPEAEWLSGTGCCGRHVSRRYACQGCSALFLSWSARSQGVTLPRQRVQCKALLGLRCVRGAGQVGNIGKEPPPSRWERQPLVWPGAFFQAQNLAASVYLCKY